MALRLVALGHSCEGPAWWVVARAGERTGRLMGSGQLCCLVGLRCMAWLSMHVEHLRHILNFTPSSELFLDPPLLCLDTDESRKTIIQQCLWSRETRGMSFERGEGERNAPE